MLAPAALALGLKLTDAGVGAAAALLAFAAMAGTAGYGLQRHYPHDRLGIANIITLARSAIIAGLCGLLAVPGGLAASDQLAWTVLAIAIFSLSLDGVDGYFARRQGLTSGFGARFDMEIDSVFGLLLALLCWQSGKAGPWVLILGGMRYLFLAAALAWPWLLAPLPERFSRKAICVVQIAVLIALLAPVISGPLSWTIAAVGTSLLTFSFGRDVVWLARHRS
ncbi:CDP-alcohol phosphatidyltransferase family protein [Devosia sp. SL43]|nr:CDP-alcohol phosphatidyltransferase family protein [Devosia sp. SL43]